MKIQLIFILFSISFVNGNAQRKLQVKPIFGNYITEYRTSENGAIIRQRKLIPIGEVFNPEIVFTFNDTNAITYQIKGYNTSGGHSINKIKKIRNEKELLDGVLVIKHYVEIVRKPGKESANILGYSYSKNERFKLPKNIKKVRIELYHVQVNRHLDSSTKLKTYNEMILS